jgi:hypothetical protein
MVHKKSCNEKCESGVGQSFAYTIAFGCGKPTQRDSGGREATRVLTTRRGGASTMKRAGRQRHPSRGCIYEPDVRRVPLISEVFADVFES